MLFNAAVRWGIMRVNPVMMVRKDGTYRKSVIVGIRQKAGLPMTVKFHHLRHTVATRLMELGTPDEIRDGILGHGKKGIRGYYAHATIKAMREALEKYEQLLWAQAEGW